MHLKRTFRNLKEIFSYLSKELLPPAPEEDPIFFGFLFCVFAFLRQGFMLLVAGSRRAVCGRARQVEGR